MPAIVIKIGRGCSTAEKRALTDKVSRCVAYSLGVVQRNVSVVLDEAHCEGPTRPLPLKWPPLASRTSLCRSTPRRAWLKQLPSSWLTEESKI